MIRKSLSLSNIELAYGEIAQLYNLREMDIERIFLEAVSTYFKTSDFWLSGDGLKITEKLESEDMRDVARKIVRYKTLTKREFKGLYGLFISMVKREQLDTVQEYLEGILQANNNILYCELVSIVEKDEVYILRPLLSKEKYIDSLVVTCKLKFNSKGEHVVFPKHIKRIPVHIGDILRNRKCAGLEHAFRANGKIMNAEMATFHLDKLNNMLKKEHNINLNLRLVKTSDNLTGVEYTADYKLPLPVIKTIGNYFRSFNVNAYINDN